MSWCKALYTAYMSTICSTVCRHHLQQHHLADLFHLELDFSNTARITFPSHQIQYPGSLGFQYILSFDQRVLLESDPKYQAAELVVHEIALHVLFYTVQLESHQENTAHRYDSSRAPSNAAASEQHFQQI